MMKRVENLPFVLFIVLSDKLTDDYSSIDWLFNVTIPSWSYITIDYINT